MKHSFHKESQNNEYLNNGTKHDDIDSGVFFERF